MAAQPPTKRSVSCARWAALDKNIVREYVDNDGIVNEFALVYNLRQSFPLHYIVFRQTAAHLPHEANSEQLFSRAGTLSDDNGKMDPHRLAVWTSIGVNYSTYKPTDEEILTRYLLKFSKGGKTTAAELHQDDLVEGLPWVPDRPTLGSRFFSGLCQVPAHKTVSCGFPRVFRFPQLVL